ncbi:hypothetical protein [Tautonia marina]|uniref:hypothetical protein n=1 Tax=Tautonia marina TaxID=2653855 RepID=UPI0012609A28|nr:hypothetical protein [Tautonia marina]
MNSWLDALLRVVLDRSIEELFGAILLSLILATVGAALGRWLCRSGKDAMARLTGVMLVMIVIGMGAGATLIQSTVPDQPQLSHQPNEFPIMMGPAAFHQMVIVLDADNNGRVEADELRKAAVALGTEDRIPSASAVDPSRPARPSFPSGSYGAAGPGAPDHLVEPDEPPDPVSNEPIDSQPTAP